MTTVLITGVAGFMGSHLADAFLDRGYSVIGIDNLIGGYAENIPDGVQFHEVDLDDLSAINEIFDGVDLVVHARAWDERNRCWAIWILFAAGRVARGEIVNHGAGVCP